MKITRGHKGRNILTVIDQSAIAVRTHCEHPNCSNAVTNTAPSFTPDLSASLAGVYKLLCREHYLQEVYIIQETI